MKPEQTWLAQPMTEFDIRFQAGIIKIENTMKRHSIPTIDVKKYGGKQVAIANGKIIASGENAKEVLREAKRKLPQANWREILLVSVPNGLTVVYRI